MGISFVIIIIIYMGRVYDGWERSWPAARDLGPSRCWLVVSSRINKYLPREKQMSLEGVLKDAPPYLLISLSHKQNRKKKKKQVSLMMT